MDSLNQSKGAIVQLLSENSSIGIIVSGNQSVDSLAAALSLHLIFQDSGKNSQVVSVKDPTVEHSFLVGIDQLTKQFSGLTRALTVSFPYKDGDIEKVSYNIEGDRLNVNLFAEETGIRFSEQDIKYIRQGSSPQLVFTLGVPQLDEIQGLIDQNAKIINIDTAANNGMYGQVNIVDPIYSSLSEIVAKLAQDFQLQVEFDVAQNLLDGITSASHNFLSPKTSPLAFEMAGFLMQKGAARKNTNTQKFTSGDTSLQMLGKQPKGPFVNGQSQYKPFNNPQTHSGMSAQFPPPSFTPPQSQTRAQQVDNNTGRQSQQVPVANKLDSQDSNPELPSEDEAPSDWFVPKVFKSNKDQQ